MRNKDSEGTQRCGDLREPVFWLRNKIGDLSSTDPGDERKKMMRKKERGRLELPLISTSCMDLDDGGDGTCKTLKEKKKQKEKKERMNE